jgi:hypothetical protein
LALRVEIDGVIPCGNVHCPGSHECHCIEKTARSNTLTDTGSGWQQAANSLKNSKIKTYRVEALHVDCSVSHIEMELEAEFSVARDAAAVKEALNNGGLLLFEGSRLITLGIASDFSVGEIIGEKLTGPKVKEYTNVVEI